VGRKVKITVLLLGTLLFLMHFTFVFFYAFPFKTKNKLAFFSQAYVYPLFQQNWNLFAPVPDANYRLFVTYQKSGKQSIDLFTRIVTQHQAKRLSGCGPFVLAFSNSIHYFERNTVFRKKINGPIVDDINFSIIEHAAYQYLRGHQKISAQKIKLILVVDEVQTNKQRIYFN
jgi:hypothetical protein